MHAVATRTQYLQITGIAILAGLIISIIKVYNDSLINDDAVLYLSMADAMLAGDWQHGLKFHPFYSILIYAVAAVTGLDSIAAAHTANALLSSALVFAFLYTFYHLGAPARLLVVVAVLVVFFPSFIKYKSMIIREHGFLTGLVFCMGNIFLYNRHRKTRFLLLAFAALAFAALFRFEAMIYIAALPLIAYIAYKGEDASLGKIAILTAVLITGCLLAFYLWILAGFDTSLVDRIPSLIENRYRLFLDKAGILANSVLSAYNRDAAGTFMISGYLAVLLAAIVHRISIVYLGLAVYGYFRPSAFNQGNIRVLWMLYVCASFITLVGLLLFHQIIVGRYTLAIAAIFIIPAAYGLYHFLYNRPQTGRTARITVYVIVGLFLLASTVQKLTVDDRSGHVREAATWIHNNIPAEAVVLSNSTVLLYHAGHSHLGKMQTGIVSGWENGRQAQYHAMIQKLDSAPRENLVKQFKGPKTVVNIYKITGPGHKQNR